MTALSTLGLGIGILVSIFLMRIAVILITDLCLWIYGLFTGGEK